MKIFIQRSRVHSKGMAITGLIFLFVFAFTATAQRVRTPINIPDIPGYRTLKCDFHIHSVFSDGDVWPTLRCEEAWREGLDALAITEHVEERYHSYNEDIKANRNRSYELALMGAKPLGLLCIKGAEITRSMPPGHLNAIFVEDIEALVKEDVKDAVAAAVKQGAFVFYNHPGWTGQQKDGISRWYPIHTELLEKKLLHGIEIVNGPEYFPRAHQWALDKNLTIVGNSDAHEPLSMSYDLHNGEHRTMTLVFAKTASIASIKEALKEGRTAVYWENSLIGKAIYLEQVFKESIQMLNPKLELPAKASAYLHIHNSSDISYELEIAGTVNDLSVPSHITLAAGKTVLFRVRSKIGKMKGAKSYALPYLVKNLVTAPGKGLPVTINIQVVGVNSEK